MSHESPFLLSNTVCVPAGRYVRHCDASASAPGRVITAILYLNPGWDTARDGGQLAIYNDEIHASGLQPAPEPLVSNNQQHLPDLCTLVSPLGGRLLLFESSIPHEVLPSHSQRCVVAAS